MRDTSWSLTPYSDATTVFGASDARIASMSAQASSVWRHAFATRRTASSSSSVRNLMSSFAGTSGFSTSRHGFSATHFFVSA